MELNDSVINRTKLLRQDLFFAESESALLHQATKALIIIAKIHEESLPQAQMALRGSHSCSSGLSGVTVYQ